MFRGRVHVVTHQIVNMFRQHLSLNGRYKFEIFDKSGNLKDTVYVNNFITATGLDYPKTIPFADCFRYISFGLGTTANSNTTSGALIGTTGLAQIHSTYKYIGGSEDEYDIRGCGYRETSSGVSLARAWRIPVGDSNFFTSDITFREMMVTPGKPYDVGPICDELDDLNTRYPSICKYDKAFSRIVSDLSVETDNYLIATYELNIGINTGVNIFALGITRQTTIGNPQNWNGNFSGVFSLVHHGLNLIRGADTTSLPGDVDANWTYDHYGDSFNGPLGSPLEPSCANGNYRLYASTDKSQFLVNEVTGGGMDTTQYLPYTSTGRRFPSGVLGYHTQPCNETNMGAKINDGTAYWFINVRQGGGEIFPSPSDFRVPTTAPISVFYAYDDTFSSPFVSVSQAGRVRYKKLNAEIRGNSIGGSDIENKSIRSVVLSYADTNLRLNSKALVFMDSIVSDKVDGLSTIDSGNYTYNINNVDSDPTYFNYLDANNNLTLEFRLSWSSPCEAGMANCTNP